MTDFNRTDGQPGGAASDSTVPPRTRRYGRKRSADRTVRSTEVQSPGTLIFQASPTTVAATLAKTDRDTLEAILASSTGVAVKKHETPGTPALSAPPVFIIGAGRSERELLGRLLAGHPNLSVGPESSVLANMAKFVADNQDQLAFQGYPLQYWYKSMADEFAALASARAVQEDKGRWIETIDHADLPLDVLERLFPICRIIHVVGDGRLKRNLRGARHAASRLSAGRYFEVRARDLETDPEQAVRAVLEFLGESTEPEVP
jgi:hypothetical protein